MVHKIEIIGLGAGDVNQLPLGIYKKLIHSKQSLFLRTKEHPVVETLEKEGVVYEAFDSLYGQFDSFTEVYRQIVEELLKEAEHRPIIYAVPGHPMLAEQTVQTLLNQNKVPVEIMGGQSYLDDLFTALKIDPIDGFQFFDATMFNRYDLNFRNHLIFCQVYDSFTASELKLTLLEDLPPGYIITIVEAAGSSNEMIKDIPLEELDRSVEVSNLTSVYVPPVQNDLLHHTFIRLREIVDILRGPNGCPWDKKQTHESIRESAIEEIYELVDAIDQKDDEGVIEELGDVLFQVMLHSKIGADAGYFSIDDVIKGITDKMIHRHPHVFKPNNEVKKKTWDELKQEEKDRHPNDSILDGVISSFPALVKAAKLQKKAADVGFDWDEVDDIWTKLEEEINEVKQAIETGIKEDIENEFGDVLFVIVNLARFYKINPETALNQTNQKFIRRFYYIEEKLKESGKTFADTTLEEMDQWWDQAKGKE